MYRTTFTTPYDQYATWSLGAPMSRELLLDLAEFAAIYFAVSFALIPIWPFVFGREN